MILKYPSNLNHDAPSTQKKSNWSRCVKFI